jgi:hypothetical protein
MVEDPDENFGEEPFDDMSLTLDDIHIDGDSSLENPIEIEVGGYETNAQENEDPSY